MARTRPTYERKPGIMDRLRKRPPPREQPAEVQVKRSKNPITGSEKVTQTTKTHPKGVGHHGHGGRGPLATERQTHHTTAPVQQHRRKPSMGDKISGALMKMKGDATHKPGVKAAGTRRMHGTDGRGSTRAY